MFDITTLIEPTPIKTVFDMETHDPDDFLTLLLLLGHPAIDLIAVTITPGTMAQVGLVRRALEWFGRDDVIVGAHRIDHPKECVSSWHERAFGKITPSRDARPGGEVLLEVCDEETTLVTGAPLKNLGDAMKDPAFCLGRLVAQGGFAGEGVVPAHLQLPKFKGMRTVPTFNLNGAPNEALAALAHPNIGERRFVSKNVCHGVVYDEAMHAWLRPLTEDAPHLDKIWHGMEVYLQKKRARFLSSSPQRVDHTLAASDVRLLGDGEAVILSLDEALALATAREEILVMVDDRAQIPVVRLTREPVIDLMESAYGKKLHDPLAACCAIDPEIGTWAEVELYRERGRWGSRPSPGSNTHIIIDYDHERFLGVFGQA